MTRTEEEALVLWSELAAGHPTMSDLEVIEHHLEMAKQEVRDSLTKGGREMTCVVDEGTRTVTLESALEVAALFTGPSGSSRGIEKVCVRRMQVEGTNGHVLMILPIEGQLWLEGYRLIPGDQARVESRVNDNVQQLLIDAVVTDADFPNTTKTMEEAKALPVECTFMVNPFYLELIGKAFGMLGIGKVKISSHGYLKPIEITGQLPSGPCVECLLMPMKY